MTLLERMHCIHLRALLFIGRTEQRRRAVLALAMLIEKGIHADDRQRPVMLTHLVMHALFLDLAALVHRLHRTEHSAALRDRLELLVYSLLHEIRQRLDGIRALPRVLDLVEP